jgi:hypothetical protein
MPFLGRIDHGIDLSSFCQSVEWTKEMPWTPGSLRTENSSYLANPVIS